MGIQGLLPFLKKATREVNIRSFSGCTVVVDAYCWLHRGAFSCAEKLGKGEKADGHVQFCVKMVNSLLAANVRPILVFDGRNLPSKSVTELKRRESKLKNKTLAKQHLLEGKLREARECFQRCVEITSQMALEAIQACRKLGVDCLVAPYEADAQLAYLNKIGIAQIVITEDSDLVLFGCDRILYKMDVNGNGMLLESDKIHVCLGLRASKFTFEKFRHMCIMSGCDYLPSLPGIGLGKSCKFFSMITNPDLNAVLSKIPTYLKMPNVNVTLEYKTGFVQADHTFLYQLVFDPVQRKLVPLNPYPEHLNMDDLEYAGSWIPDEVALQLSLGNVDLNTMKKVDDFDPDNNNVGMKTSSWSSKPTKSIWSRNYEVKSVDDKVENSPSSLGFLGSSRTIGRQTATVTPRTSSSNIKRSLSESKSENAGISESDIMSQYGSTKKAKIDVGSESTTIQSRSPVFSQYFETHHSISKPIPDCSNVTPNTVQEDRSSLSSVESSPVTNEYHSSPDATFPADVSIESKSSSVDLSEEKDDKINVVKTDAPTPRGSLIFDRAITSKKPQQTPSICPYFAPKTPTVGNFGCSRKSLDNLLGFKTSPNDESMFARSPSNHTNFKSVIVRRISEENVDQDKETSENSSQKSSKMELSQGKCLTYSFNSFTEATDGFSPQCSQEESEMTTDNWKHSTPDVLQSLSVNTIVDTPSKCRRLGLPRKKRDKADTKQLNLKDMFAQFTYQKQRPSSSLSSN